LRKPANAGGGVDEANGVPIDLTDSGALRARRLAQHRDVADRSALPTSPQIDFKIHY
jgi:hypothetical protein